MEFVHTPSLVLAAPNGTSNPVTASDADLDHLFGRQPKHRPEDHLPEDISPGFRNPDNPWSQVASHLIWLGARQIKHFTAKEGVDPNAVLAKISKFCHSPSLDYGRREAAAAQVLYDNFHEIVLVEGTRAAG